MTDAFDKMVAEWRAGLCLAFRGAFVFFIHRAERRGESGARRRRFLFAGRGGRARRSVRQLADRNSTGVGCIAAHTRLTQARRLDQTAR
jgi:hypothetical protein